VQFADTFIVVERHDDPQLTLTGRERRPRHPRAMRFRHAAAVALAFVAAVTVLGGCAGGDEASFEAKESTTSTSTSESTTTEASATTGDDGSEETTTSVEGDPDAPSDGGELDWTTTAVDHVRGDRGTFTVACPAEGEVHSVWGTELYTGDSSICTAAVHAGTITLAEGGEVTFTMEPGQTRYEGSEANGVTSSSWGPFRTSFRVEA
jgi:hypothetical protein